MAQNCANITRIYDIKIKAEKKNTSRTITQQECREICTFDSPLEGCKLSNKSANRSNGVRGIMCCEQSFTLVTIAEFRTKFAKISRYAVDYGS